MQLFEVISLELSVFPNGHPTDKLAFFQINKKEKSVETLRFNALFVVAGTGLEPATSGL